MRRSAGSTLIELMIVMGIFGLLITTIFLLFGIGSRGFRTIETRQTAQNQLAAIRASLQQDLQVTHFYGVALDNSVAIDIGGKSRRRDAFSAVSLSDWDRSGAIDEYGVPQWDQWVLYRVTNEEQGQLLRHVVTPLAGQHGRTLLRGADGLNTLSRMVAAYDPAWGGVKPPRVLARGVRSLEIRLNQDLRGVQISVTIEQKTDPKNPKPDVLTANFFIKPHNTVPTD